MKMIRMPDDSDDDLSVPEKPNKCYNFQEDFNIKTLEEANNMLCPTCKYKVSEHAHRPVCIYKYEDFNITTAAQQQDTCKYCHVKIMRNAHKDPSSSSYYFYY